jgi:fermentation-respiration switch protein FrsA (DUF1100 family)
MHSSVGMDSSENTLAIARPGKRHRHRLTSVLWCAAASLVIFAAGIATAVLAVGVASAPVLLASGTRDDRTTMAETTAMFDRAKNPKSLWAVADARHVDLEAYAPEDYRRRVLPFLMETLQQ